MTIRLRVQLAFAVIVLTALGIALTSYLQSRRLDGDARAINLSGSQRMRAYRLATLASQYAAYRDLATGSAIEDELTRFEAVLRTLLRGDPAEGVKPASDGQSQAALREAEALFDRFAPRVRRLVREVDAGDDPNRWLEIQAVVAMATSLAEHADDATVALERASAAEVRQHRDVQLGLMGLAIVVALLTFEVLRRMLGRGLPALREALDDLAAGRLGGEVHIGRGHDEIASLGEAFNRMSHELERSRSAILAHEAALARRNEELLRVDGLKSRFLANMSHELKTPLTSILGFADLLLRGTYGELSAKQVDRVEAIKRNGRHLLVLIGDILDLSRIEADRLEVHPERLAPGPLVAEVADALRPLADGQGLALEVDVADGLPEVETDPARVRQILMNLIGNAVKFTQRGSVTVRARAVPDEPAVRVEVEDTGVGIPQDQVDRMFERFAQLDGLQTRQHGGTGLGLHISKRLADLLGGRLEARSEPGRGSRFALVIPERFEGPRAAVAPSASARGPETAG